MCAPALAIASIGMAGLQAGVAFQAKQADYEAKSAQYVQNVVNSEAAARDEYRQIIGNQLVEQNKLIQQQHVSLLQQVQKQSSAETAAVGAGVGGLSVDNILRDIAGKSEQNRTYADLNYKFVVQDTTNKLRSADDTEQSRLNNLPLPMSPSPATIPLSMADAGLKLGGPNGALRGLSMGDA